MTDTLIITGWGWKEYAVAAALALKAHHGDADVLGVSKRRLPELLEGLDVRYKKVVILGVALSGDEDRLQKALTALRQRKVQIVFITGIALDGSLQRNIEPLLTKCFLCELSLLDAVGQFYGVDVKPFSAYALEGGRPSKAVKSYHVLMEAAMFAYRNYQDSEAYAKTIRYLASGVSPDTWGQDMKSLVAHYERYGSRELVGKSPQMRSLQECINRVAVHPDARVLILGESGTGKETVAWQIHTKSPRAREPFIAFNCASVAKELLESRIFGHEKGSFTGADRQYKGLFEQADGGTLFLDEIGEMPKETQALLLRVLEGGRFMRVGGSEEITVDVRVIAATNRDLPALVREGRFREDLFYRLNIVQLRTPSLREHKEDIRNIADGWWLKHHKRHLDEKSIAALMEYDYPGNVRELLNILERATALGEDDFEALMEAHREMNVGLAHGTTPASGLLPDGLEDAMHAHVRRICEKCGQNLTKAASVLKVTRNTVRKYLK